MRPKLAIWLLTCLALTGFAANSVLARLAMADGAIDPVSFTTLRVVSGAIFLAVVIGFSKGQFTRVEWRPVMALALLVYMVGFTFAYLSLPTGIGALVLFGSVQVTMLTAGLIQGDHFNRLGWLGFVLAMAGLVMIANPARMTEAGYGLVFMALAGVGWGFYSLLGKSAKDPLGATTGNFVLCSPALIALWLLPVFETTSSVMGLVYAVLSGVVASGAGYAIWYAALRQLSASLAGVSQLSVPVIAAFGGLALLGEPISLILIIASTLTLGGIALVLASKR